VREGGAREVEGGSVRFSLTGSQCHAGWEKLVASVGAWAGSQKFTNFPRLLLLARGS
jgi:hypothetical protein